MTESLKDISPEAIWHTHIFKSSLPMRMRLQEILNSLGNTKFYTCLDIGSDNAMVTYHLRKHGGTWHSLVMNKNEGSAIREVVKDNVRVFKGMPLPFGDKTFDVVVVLNELERVESDEAFIEECHRILKPDGKIIVTVERKKVITIIPSFRRLLGLSHEKREMYRPGYTESQLFSILKHGFDVYNLRTYCRFSVVFTESLARFFVKLFSRNEDEFNEKVRRVYSVARVFYAFAAQLDMLLFLTKGYQMIAAAKRRAWRPREAPVLTDGRSITEAVLSRAPK